MITIKFILVSDKNHFIKLNILIELFNSYHWLIKAKGIINYLIDEVKINHFYLPNI